MYAPQRAVKRAKHLTYTSPVLSEHPLVAHRNIISFGARAEALGHPIVHHHRHVEAASDHYVLRAHVVVADSLRTAAAIVAAGSIMCMPVTHMSKYTYILRCFDLFWLVFLRTRTVWPKLNVFTAVSYTHLTLPTILLV